jgi:hypothetical protein
MKVFCAAFMCLHFGFVIFWQKDFGAKVAHKMLVKLTLGCKSLIVTNTLAYCNAKLLFSTLKVFTRFSNEV